MTNKFLMLAAAASLAMAGTAHANYVINITQAGSNVIASGTGTYDFVPLTFVGFDIPINVAINPSAGYLGFGNENAGGGAENAADNYMTVAGPMSFGSGGLTVADATTGTVGGISGGISEVIVPPGYSADTATVDSLTTWNNTTIAGLGLTSGTYVWTWGNGDSFTLNVACTAVPEPGSWVLMLAGFGLVGHALRRRASTLRQAPKVAIA